MVGHIFFNLSLIKVIQIKKRKDLYYETKKNIFKCFVDISHS